MKPFRHLAKLLAIPALLIGEPALANDNVTDEVRDCKALRKELSWTRQQYWQCKTEETQKSIAQSEQKLAAQKAWLQARGLDLNDDGIIVDGSGRTLAQIEVKNTQLEQSNAALQIKGQQLKLDISTLDDEHRRILQDFQQYLIGEI